MRTLTSAATLAALGLTSAGPAALAASQQAPSAGPRLRVAVMEPGWERGTIQSSWALGGNAPDAFVQERQTFSRGMSEMMVAELLESGRFVVVERQALEDVLAEQDLQYSGAVNPETAAQAGRLIGAQYLIRPAITEFSYGQEGGTKGGAVRVPVRVPIAGDVSIGGGKSKIVARLVIDTRIYDVETGQIVSSVRSEAAAEQTASQLDLGTDVFDYNSGKFEKTPLGAATRAAVSDAVAGIVGELGDKPWQGRVVTVRDGQVYVNAGADTGLEPGAVLGVYRPGEALVDPETGLNLGQIETRLGEIRIVAVQEKFSIGEAVGSFSCERNDIVRYGGR